MLAGAAYLTVAALASPVASTSRAHSLVSGSTGISDDADGHRPVPCSCSSLRREHLGSSQLAVEDARLGALGAATASLKRFVLFSGYPRSGHTLVGSLLDAHPAVTIANEFDALPYIARARPTRDQLFRALATNSERCALVGRMQTSTNYTYDNLDHAGTWCAAARDAGASCAPVQPMIAIGDKKGGSTELTLRDEADPVAALLRLSSGLLQGLPIRLVHVIRSPFEIIATELLIRWLAAAAPNCTRRFAAYRDGKAALRANGTLLTGTADGWREFTRDVCQRLRGNGHLRDAIARAPGLCVTDTAAPDACERGRPPVAWIDSSYEDWLSDPQGQLRAVLGFVGVSADDAFLDAAAGAVEPHESRERDLLLWPRPAVQQVLSELETMGASGNGTAAGGRLAPMLAAYTRDESLPPHVRAEYPA